MHITHLTNMSLVSAQQLANGEIEMHGCDALVVTGNIKTNDITTRLATPKGSSSLSVQDHQDSREVRSRSQCCLDVEAMLMKATTVPRKPALSDCLRCKCAHSLLYLGRIHRGTRL